VLSSEASPLRDRSTPAVEAPTPGNGSAAPNSLPAGGAAEDPHMTRQVSASLAVLVVSGVAVSAWVLFYTDWFPVLGGLLGLGGLFAWAAFVAGVLSDDRKEELQRAFETRVLGRSWTPATLLLLLLAFLLWASLEGSVRLDSRGDDHSRVAWIQPEAFVSAEHKAGDGYVAPRSLQTYSLFTGWRTRRFYLKMAGLPAREVLVQPLRRQTLAIPDDFASRPVVLIRPKPLVSSNAEKVPYKLSVMLNGSLLGYIDAGQYHGETVWVGCDVDVAIPDRLSSLWRIELLQKYQRDDSLVRWSAPLAVAMDKLLKPGDKVAVTLQEAGETMPYASGSTVVLPVLRGQTYVQELELNYLQGGQTGGPQPSPGSPPTQEKSNASTPPS